MNALALAKRRVARRRREDGAVMFIVAMTLAVLASVGIYALAAAATEVKTSGNERQNTQTHYLSQYGILSAARYMDNHALFAVGLMKSNKYQDTNCVSLPGVPAGTTAAQCVRMGSKDLNNNEWSQAFTNGVPPGSFGPAPMGGDFFVEFTEPMQVDAPRYSSNANTCFAQITATSIGYTQPGTGGTPTATVLEAKGVEMQRARFIAGPLNPCPL